MDEADTHSNKLKLKKFIPGIAWFFVVLVLMCLPGDDIPKVDDWFEKIYFDKWAHTGIFAIMAYLFMRPVGLSGMQVKNKWLIFILIVVILSLWGLATEFIQKNFVPGRGFDLFDWAADTLGCIIALAFGKKYFLAPSS